MAKNPKAEVEVVRKSKPKSPAQLAKKERNIAEAKARLERLQEKQSMANRLRKLGYAGTDDEVIVKFMEDQRLKEAAVYVDMVLAVPKFGAIIQRWLKDRVDQSPIYVKQLIENFLERDGSKPGHKDNRHIKEAVNEYLNSEQGQRILAHKLAA